VASGLGKRQGGIKVVVPKVQNNRLYESQEKTKKARTVGGPSVSGKSVAQRPDWQMNWLQLRRLREREENRIGCPGRDEREKPVRILKIRLSMGEVSWIDAQGRLGPETTPVNFKNFLKYCYKRKMSTLRRK